MKTPKAPTPPTPQEQAAAQTQSNRDTATYNNAIEHGNIYTPLGNSTYTGRIDPVTGATVYDQTVSLDPAQQALLDTQNQQDLALGQTGNALLGQINSTIGQPMDTSGLPGLMGAVNFQQIGGNAGQTDQLDVNGPGLQGTLSTSGLPELQNLTADGLPQLYGADDLMGARNQVSDALYRQQSSYLDPQYAQQDQALRTELANKGVAEGSEAWNRMMGDFARNKSFDYARARDSAITGSGAELSRLAQIAQSNRGQLFGERGAMASNAASNRGQLFGERAAAGEFQNSAQGQAVAEALARAGFGNDARLTNASFANDATSQNNANALMAAQFQNAARGQGLNEAYAARAEPLNMFSALRGATQVDVPQFEAAQNSVTNPADIGGYMGQAYQNQLQAYQSKMASRNAVLSGLFGLGSAGLTGGLGLLKP